MFAEAFRDSGCPAKKSKKDLCWSDMRPTFDESGYISSA